MFLSIHWMWLGSTTTVYPIDFHCKFHRTKIQNKEMTDSWPLTCSINDESSAISKINEPQYATLLLKLLKLLFVYMFRLYIKLFCLHHINQCQPVWSIFPCREWLTLLQQSDTVLSPAIILNDLTLNKKHQCTSF